jgi:SAM-dependent methyltransferase
MFACRICHNVAGNEAFTAREMMFGSREEFTYFTCAGCGCLQIAAVPDDMAPYYPPDYYSYHLCEPGALKRFFKRRHARHALGERNLLGRLLDRRYPRPDFVAWVERADVASTDAVLDVGCGAGQLLLEMQVAGFTNLTGIDPYLAGETARGPGLRILRRSLDDVSGLFDFVMLHHAFEHFADPLASLRRVRRLLSPGGTVLIRVPVADTYAWRTYGVDWVQLDAPRHFFLHTRRSMAILAAAADLTVTDVSYDATAFQFWGSEQYRRGIPLRDDRSYGVNPHASVFTAADIRRFEREADRLNRDGEGDQACFYLHRS